MLLRLFVLFALVPIAELMTLLEVYRGVANRWGTGAGLAVTFGSISATSGIRWREMMPVLALIDLSAKIAMPVVSDPVPDVVGHAMCGFIGPGTFCPAPIGAFT